MLVRIGQAQSEVAALRLQLEACRQDAQELQRFRRRALAAEQKLKALEWDHEVALACKQL